jgi:hypothetical protein
MTVLCCTNIKFEKRDLLVIGKSKTPRCFKRVRSLPVDYYSSENAWLTSVMFNDWLVKLDLELKRKFFLLAAKCTVHKQFVITEHQNDLLACEHVTI